MQKPIRRSRKRISAQTVVGSSARKKGQKRYLIVLTVLGIMVTAIAAIGALASWRRLSNITPPVANYGILPDYSASNPSKEFVYSGSSLVSTVEPFREAPSDLAVWRPSSGIWYILSGQSQVATQQFGASGDIVAPGDFDGDGKTDFCVFRPSNTTWYIVRSSDGMNQYAVFGMADDLPVIADYDGDGRSDIAVWRPSNQTWYIQNSSDSSTHFLPFGASGDRPVPADYDGDGKADLAVWRDSEAKFYVRGSSSANTFYYSIGQTGDEPVIGDYDGDGRADFALRRASDTYWRILPSSDNSQQILSVSWGMASDIALPARYNDSADNDAKTDIAVWRPSTGVWYIRRSSDGTLRAQAFGMDGDIPVPSNWQR